MIRSFADKRTKAVFEDVPVKGLGPDVRRAARKKLLMLDRARNIADLRVPPGNRPPCAVVVLVSIASGSTTSGASASSGAKETLTTSRSRTITEEQQS